MPVTDRNADPVKHYINGPLIPKNKYHYYDASDFGKHVNAVVIERHGRTGLTSANDIAAIHYLLKSKSINFYGNTKGFEIDVRLINKAYIEAKKYEDQDRLISKCKNHKTN